MVVVCGYVIEIVSDIVSQLLDNNSGETSKETRWHTQQQHELLLRHVRMTPFVDLLRR